MKVSTVGPTVPAVDVAVRQNKPFGYLFVRMSGEYPKKPPDDVPAKHHSRARQLQLELVVLEARLESANFEEKEAYRRAIRDRREELDSLRQSPIE